MIRVTDQGQVIYLAEKNAPQRFPKPASENLFGDISRNFQLFDPLDFIAQLTQHIPDHGKHLLRSYGFYSTKSRGLRAKAAAEAAGQKERATSATERATTTRHLLR